MQPPPPHPGMPRAQPLAGSWLAVPTRPGTENARAVRSLPQLSQATGESRSDMLRIAWKRRPQPSQTYS